MTIKDISGLTPLQKVQYIRVTWPSNCHHIKSVHCYLWCTQRRQRSDRGEQRRQRVLVVWYYHRSSSFPITKAEASLILVDLSHMFTAQYIYTTIYNAIYSNHELLVVPVLIKIYMNVKSFHRFIPNKCKLTFQDPFTAKRGSFSLSLQPEPPSWQCQP
jgi:hypothetical protein